MKYFHIVVVLLTSAMIFVCYIFMNIISELRNSLHLEGETLNYFYVTGIQSEIQDYTMMAGLISFIAIGIIVVMFAQNLKTYSEKHIKIISIVGEVLSMVLLAWNYLMINSSGKISFDEVGYVWMGYFFVSLVFAAVSYRESRIKDQAQAFKDQNQETILDDIDF